MAPSPPPCGKDRTRLLASRFRCDSYLSRVTEMMLQQPDGIDGLNPVAIRTILSQMQASKKKDAVQEGDVSSSQPTFLASQITPLLLDTLDGFLLIISNDGLVEFVSNNVTRYLSVRENDMLNQSIANFVAPNDYELFQRILPNNNCAATSPERCQESSQQTAGELRRGQRGEQFTVRFRDPNSGDEVPLRVVAFSFPYPPPDQELGEDIFAYAGSGSSPHTCLVCVVRKPVNHVPQQEHSGIAQRPPPSGQGPGPPPPLNVHQHAAFMAQRDMGHRALEPLKPAEASKLSQSMKGGLGGWAGVAAKVYPQAGHFELSLSPQLEVCGFDCSESDLCKRLTRDIIRGSSLCNICSSEDAPLLKYKVEADLEDNLPPGMFPIRMCLSGFLIGVQFSPLPNQSRGPRPSPVAHFECFISSEDLSRLLAKPVENSSPFAVSDPVASSHTSTPNFTNEQNYQQPGSTYRYQQEDSFGTSSFDPNTMYGGGYMGTSQQSCFGGGGRSDAVPSQDFFEPCFAEFSTEPADIFRSGNDMPEMSASGTFPNTMGGTDTSRNFVSTPTGSPGPPRPLTPAAGPSRHRTMSYGGQSVGTPTCSSVGDFPGSVPATFVDCTTPLPSTYASPMSMPPISQGNGTGAGPGSVGPMSSTSSPLVSTTMSPVPGNSGGPLGHVDQSGDGNAPDTLQEIYQTIFNEDEIMSFLNSDMGQPSSYEDSLGQGLPYGSMVPGDANMPIPQDGYGMQLGEGYGESTTGESPRLLKDLLQSAPFGNGQPPRRFPVPTDLNVPGMPMVPPAGGSLPGTPTMPFPSPSAPPPTKAGPRQKRAKSSKTLEQLLKTEGANGPPSQHGLLRKMLNEEDKNRAFHEPDSSTGFDPLPEPPPARRTPSRKRKATPEGRSPGRRGGRANSSSASTCQKNTPLLSSLLAQPHQVTPTLPTSIAVSPYDRPAMPKDANGHPMAPGFRMMPGGDPSHKIQTGLVESLLSKQRYDGSMVQPGMGAPPGPPGMRPGRPGPTQGPVITEMVTGSPWDQMAAMHHQQQYAQMNGGSYQPNGAMPPPSAGPSRAMQQRWYQQQQIQQNGSRSLPTTPTMNRPMMPSGVSPTGPGPGPSDWQDFGPNGPMMVPGPPPMTYNPPPPSAPQQWRGMKLPPKPAFSPHPAATQQQLPSPGPRPRPPTSGTPQRMSAPSPLAFAEAVRNPWDGMQITRSPNPAFVSNPGGVGMGSGGSFAAPGFQNDCVSRSMSMPNGQMRNPPGPPSCGMGDPGTPQMQPSDGTGIPSMDKLPPAYDLSQQGGFFF